ncbi:hypothetical protein SAMN04488056_1167 [Cohaesibacter marisflavi]|uniref:Uncharacterized protein n=1 Tax=Cohaesibacter marisflavi TaxID=655353 RepID=A0A1I5L609_9HYPH|nr:hypothetical protein SAMN04488056_1167 [Cohaesibacter marisflavi]
MIPLDQEGSGKVGEYDDPRARRPADHCFNQPGRGVLVEGSMADLLLPLAEKASHIDRSIPTSLSPVAKGARDYA